MSIRFRLLLSYIAMLVIPVVLTLIAAVLIGYFYIGDVRDVYKSDFEFYSVQKIIQAGSMTLEEIKLTANT